VGDIEFFRSREKFEGLGGEAPRVRLKNYSIVGNVEKGHIKKFKIQGLEMKVNTP